MHEGRLISLLATEYLSPRKREHPTDAKRRHSLGTGYLSPVTLERPNAVSAVASAQKPVQCAMKCVQDADALVCGKRWG